METTELWRPVVGFEDHYQVSNLGNVRRAPGSPRCPDGRPRKLVQRGKYFQVILSKCGSVQLHWVHRLVAFAFLGAPPAGTDRINHKDGNGLNNAVENLEWVSHSGNMQHAYDTGLRVATPPLGEANGYSKLTERDVREIRALYGSVKTSQLARRFDIGRSAIHSVATRRTWKHVL